MKKNVPFKGGVARRALLNTEINVRKHGQATFLTGTLVECRGKNIRLDVAGTMHWVWVPDIEEVWIETAELQV